MKGKEEIIKKIIKDAQKIATSTLEEGVAKAQETINLAENDAKIFRSKNRTESQQERDDIIRRRITVANLEVKKLMLAAKQQVIGKAFEESIDVIKKDKKGYTQMLKGMLGYASDGDTLTISKSDKDIFTKKFIDEAVAKKGIKVTLNKQLGEFKGGIILSSAGSDKNFTLEVELASLRDEIEPEIARMLFGDQ